MTNRTCSVDGCESKHAARGYCGTHYARVARSGSTDKPERKRRSPMERFWAKVDKSGPVPSANPALGRCWVYTAGKSVKGYGSFWDGNTVLPAHKFHYMQVKGSVPAGMVLDHACHNKACVNLAHLRLTTNKHNCEYRNGPNRNNTTSGVRGVTPNGSGWKVEIRHNGEKLRFGTYRTIAEAEAVAVRERARLFRFPEVKRPTRAGVAA